MSFSSSVDSLNKYLGSVLKLFLRIIRRICIDLKSEVTNNAVIKNNEITTDLRSEVKLSLRIRADPRSDNEREGCLVL